LIGQEKKVFIIHQRLLSRSSAYFRAACCANFQESVIDEIQLQESEHEILNHFAKWTYNQLVHISWAHSDRWLRFRIREEARAYTNETWSLFTQIYLLAQYFHSPAFGNDVRNLQQHHHRCALRRYLIALYIGGSWSTCIGEWPPWDQHLASLRAECILDIAITSTNKNRSEVSSPFAGGYPDRMELFQD
jgi:hypothetical protein